MDSEGFIDIISSDDGINYNIPDGKYTITGNYKKSELLEKAKKAINITGVEGSSFVTQSNGRT